MGIKIARVFSPQSRAETRASRRWGPVRALLLVCVLLACTAPGRAQSDPREGELSALRDAVERARFDDAHARAEALLSRSDLTARQRNDALELLAIAQIAAREDEAARATLSELFARDPEHPERLHDPGPTVVAAFARGRSEPRPPRTVQVTSSVAQTGLGRVLLEVRLGPGQDAVDSVHVFAESASGLEPTHLIAEPRGREAVVVALPALGPRQQLSVYVEARAPSGAVIGKEGSADEPLVIELPRDVLACPVPPPPKPLRRAWWLWTSVAIVVAGIGVSGALAAH